MDRLRKLGALFPGAWHKAGAGYSSAQMPPDLVHAMSVEESRLCGISLSHGRSGWTRAFSGAWPVVFPAPVPEGDAGAVEPAGTVLADAFVAARAAMNAEAVAIGLPTSVLLLRILRMPVLSREEMTEAVVLQVDKLSPFPGDELTIGWEILSERNEEAVVLVAAVPARHMETLNAALTAAGLRIVRIDVSLLDWLRVLRARRLLVEVEGRQAVLIAAGSEWDLLVIDNGVPVLARGLGKPMEDDDLARELTLSLFQAEMDAGVLHLRDVVLFSASTPPDAAMAAIRANVSPEARCISLADDTTAADGLCLRTVEGASLDLTPAAWRVHERSEVVRRRVTLGVAAALGLWAALAGMVFLGPTVTGQLINMQKRQESQFIQDFRRASDLRLRIALIQRYMDRSGSLLESLRTVTEVQPDGVELNSLSYERGKGCRLAGEASHPDQVNQFTDQLRNHAPFVACKLGLVSITPAQKHRFDLEATLGEGAP